MKSTTLLKCFTVALILISQLSIAQIKIGAKVGYSLGRLTDNSDNIYTADYESTSGVDFGFLVEFPISELFSIQTEILYTQRGGERKGLQPVPLAPLESALGELGVSLDILNQILAIQEKSPISDQNPLYAEFNNTSNLDYLEIPVLGKLGWGTEWRFYVEAGPYIGFLLNSKQETSGTSSFFLNPNGTDPLTVPNPYYNPFDPSFGPAFVPVPPQSFDGNTDTKNELNTFNAGFHAGAGLIRRFAEKHEVFLGFRGSYGFIPIQKNEIFGESHIGGLVFSLGYAYVL